jgi:hypothetical protein
VFNLPLRADDVKICDIKTGNGDLNEYRKQIDDSMAGSARQVQCLFILVQSREGHQRHLTILTSI